MGEVIRRVTGLTPGQFWRQEIGEPLCLRTWIGLPESEMESVARTEMSRDFDSRPVLSDLDERAGTMTGAIHSRAWVRAVVQAARDPPRRVARRQRISTARSLAKAYAACLDEVDGIRLLSHTSLEDALIERGRQWADAPDDDGPRWGTGFMLASPPWQPMLGQHSFGHSGAGGQLAFADPDRHLAFAYVTRQMGQDGMDGRSGWLVPSLGSNRSRMVSVPSVPIRQPS